MTNQPPPAPPGPQDPYQPQPPQGYQGQPQQGQGDYRDAKAQAKAAKAYAKAQRPWYKKKRFILPLALVLLIVIISVASSGGDDPATTATPETQESAASALPSDEQSSAAEEEVPVAEDPAGKLPLQDGDWRLDQLRLENNGFSDDFGGTARVTYTGDNEEGGTNIFTITVFKGAEAVATLQGSANTVKPNSTVSVQLISTDKYVKGPYKYDFQNDL
jgi:hypothetical protein